jgi:hypothetical protein
MKRYAIMFAVAYLLLTVILGAILEFFRLGGNAGVNIAATLAASFFAAGKFAKEQGSLPTPEQTKAYSWMALLAVWIVSLLLALVAFALLLSPAETSSILKLASSGFFLIVAIVGGLVLSLIYYIAIKWSFSWYAKKALVA